MDKKLIMVGCMEGEFESNNRVYDRKGLSPNITTCGGGDREPKVVKKLGGAASTSMQARIGKEGRSEV